MSLKVWLPLMGDLKNYGTQSLPNPSANSFTYGAGKIGECASGRAAWVLPEEILDNTWSIAMWVRPESLDANNNILFCKNGTASTDCQIYFSIISTTKLNIGVNGPASSVTATGQTFTLNKWYHVAATYDGQIASVYLNGQLLKSGTVTTAKPTGRLNMNINGRCTNAGNTGTTGNFTGAFNDFRLYDHCLTPLEVKEIAQGLILHYKLDGGVFGNSNILTNSTGLYGTTDWSGEISIGTENNEPYLIAKRINTTSTSRTFVTHTAITSYVSGWSAGTKFTLSGYYKVPSNETFAAGANMFIRWNYASTFADTGFTVPTSTVKDTWIYFAYTYTVPANYTGGTVNFYLSAFSQALSTIYWKKIKLEKNSFATPWCPTDSEFSIDRTLIPDSSGYNHNGDAIGSVTLSSETARYNASTDLSASNSAINCGKGGKLTDSLTVNFWLKSSAWANPVSCTEGGGWNFEASGDYFRFVVYAAGVGYKYGQSATKRSEICNNQWHMLTGVYDRVNSKIKIYVDGNLDDDYSTGTTNEIGYNASNVIWIGAEASGSATAFGSKGMAGLFSDFRIYATALLDADIKKLYNTGMSIDKAGQVHTFELDEKMDNIMFLTELSRTNLTYSNGLSRYTQANCQVTLTERGYHIYRPPNLTTSANGNTMWGGLQLVNQASNSVSAYTTPRDNIWHLQKGHTYLLTFHAEGQSSNNNSFGWTNNMGWGGGGVQPSPVTILNDAIPANFQGEKECTYIFTINDDIAKTCTSAYSSYVANTVYLSYRHLTFGWGYSSTGELGTDLYLTGFQLYDITNVTGKLFKTGELQFSAFIESLLPQASVQRGEIFLANEFIER